MSIKEKVAYLKGLAEGLGLDSESKEGKLIAIIIDTLADVSEELEALTENALDIGDELDALSDSLADVEDILYDEDYDFDDDEDDYDDFGSFGDDDFSCGCGCGGPSDIVYEVACPACDAEIVLEESSLAFGSTNCPSCGETLEFEFDEDDEFMDMDEQPAE